MNFFSHFYEQKAIQYLAARGPILRNPIIHGNEIDGLLNDTPIEIKSFPVDHKLLKALVKKAKRLNFHKLIVVAPDFRCSETPEVEFVKFNPDFGHLINYYQRWRPRIPRFIRLRWRQVRVETPSGFVKIHDRIISLNKLRHAILSFKEPPLRVYMSQLEWLRPDEIGAKNIKDICLGTDFLIFDVDGTNLHSHHFIYKNGLCKKCIEQAKKETIHLAEYLETRFGYSNFFVIFSGRKGFHLYVLDYGRIRTDQKFVEYREQKRRRKIVELIKKAGIRIDENTTIDTRRIIGVPSTLHSFTGLPLYAIGDIQKLERFKIKFPADG
jgi:DNA primase catalytic subunit